MDLADKCGTSISTVVRIENGIDSKLSNYIKILNALGLMQNLDILIPKLQPDFKAIFEKNLQGKGLSRIILKQNQVGCGKKINEVDKV